jgi:hypothetical protein
MANPHGWQRCPDTVREQTLHLVSGLGERLNTSLVGIYLHGSLAMGCFSLAQSDIDLVVVSRRPMQLATKRAVAEFLLALSGAPWPSRDQCSQRSGS